MSWMKNQKDHCFEVSFSPIRHNNNEPCFNWIVTCNEKWILYDDQWWAALWLDQETPKHLPQPNLHQKKVVVTVWWSAAGLIHYSFLNPSKTITTEKYVQPIHEMHEKLQSLQPALLNRKVPILLHNTWLHQHFKSWTNFCLFNKQNKAMKLCLICHIQLTTTSSSISTTFCRKMLPQWAGGRKCFPRVHRILKHRFLCYRNKETYFLLAKICWL